MGSTEHVLDNALCESFLTTFEMERIDQRRLATQTEGRIEVFGFVDDRHVAIQETNDG